MNVIKDHFSKIKEKNRELEDKLNDFQQASINNFINIEERLKNIEIKTLIDQEIVKLESSDKYDIFKDYSLKIFIFMDNLFSGRFGLYDLNNQKENIDYLEDKLKVYLKREIGNNCLKDYINFEDIHNNIKDFDDLEKSAISYISNCQSTFIRTFTNSFNTKLRNRINLYSYFFFTKRRIKTYSRNRKIYLAKTTTKAKLI